MDRVKLIRIILVSFALGFLVFLVIFLPKIVKTQKAGIKEQKLPEVSLPSIIDGQLVLPKIDATTAATRENLVNFGRPALAIQSINLVGVYDQQSTLTSLRILGETRNVGKSFVDSFIPVVKFYSEDGETVAQKIAKNSPNYNFFGLEPEESTVFDLVIDSPPVSTRVEMTLSASSSTTAGAMASLKIQDKSLEVLPASASGQTVDIYNVSGSVVNTREIAVSDIVVVGWARDDQGRIFGIARQDFKSDLITPGQTLPFKLIILPVRLDQKFDSFELQAWGREYRL